MKSKKVTLLLSFFLGNFGIHRFYVGKIRTGILWLFTFGLFGIGNLIDFIRICVGEFKDKHGNPLRDDCSKTLIVVLVAMWAFLFVIGFISGFVSSVNSSSNTTNDYQNTYTEQYENNVVNDSVEKTHSNDYIENEVKKEETKVPTVVEYETVNITKMLDELDGNALRAEKTYQDRYIEITGKISNIDSDGEYISISDPNDEWGWDTVHCSITEENQLDVVIGKNEGDLVTIKGQVVSIGEILGYTVDIHSIK